MISEPLIPTTFIRPKPDGDILGLLAPEPVFIIGPQRWPGEDINYSDREQWRVERVTVEADERGVRQTVYVSIISTTESEDAP